MLMLAPKAPAPLMLVPRPRCTWTWESMLWRLGMFTQKTSCDSASLRLMPLSVTLIWEPLEPRMVMAEFPRPVPPSLYVTTDGSRLKVMGSELTGLASDSASLDKELKVTGVRSPARDDRTTALSSLSWRSPSSCA